MPLEVLPVPIALSAEPFPGLPGDPWYVTCRDEANRLVSEYTASPSGLTRTRDYFYFGNLLVASEDGTGNFRFYVSDHLGTMRLETDAMGSVVHHDYLPYGEEMDSNVTSTPIKFAGMERDASSGNDYDHARFSLTGMGRFGSVDRHSGEPARPISWNKYIYASDNPLIRIDPNGLTDINIIIQRQDETSNATEGTIIIVGTNIRGYTIEPPFRNNKRYISAIPAGTYGAFLFSSHKFRSTVIRLRGVPDRSAIEIHRGNTAKDTTGCILPGSCRVGPGVVAYSAKKMNEITNYIQSVKKKDRATGESTTITVTVRNPQPPSAPPPAQGPCPGGNTMSGGKCDK